MHRLTGFIIINLTALVPRCTKTSFLLTPHYICAHRNSNNLNNADFIGYFLVARVMADEHLIALTSVEKARLAIH